MSAYPSKRDLVMLKTRFEKRVAFVPSLFPKRVIKTRFAIFNKVSFAVSSNLVCIVILFKIVTLIFPHRLRVCNAIYVEYRVLYRLVVLHIACTVKSRFRMHRGKYKFNTFFQI